MNPSALFLMDRFLLPWKIGHLNYRHVLKTLWVLVGEPGTGHPVQRTDYGLLFPGDSVSLAMCMNGSSTWLLHRARGGPCVPCFQHSWCEQLCDTLVWGVPLAVHPILGVQNSFCSVLEGGAGRGTAPAPLLLPAAVNLSITR